MTILRETDITQNVTSALIRDNQRKLDLIHRLSTISPLYEVLPFSRVFVREKSFT
jgi:hypothetical protein